LNDIRPRAGIGGEKCRIAENREKKRETRLCRKDVRDLSIGLFPSKRMSLYRENEMNASFLPAGEISGNVPLETASGGTIR
jgi:hypothetical protein